MGSVCSLGIHCRVPVVIIENHSVSPCQVHSQSSCPCAQQESEDVFILLVLLHHVPPIRDGSGPIHSEVSVLPPAEEVFQDVQHASHLAENQTPMVGNLQLHKQFIQKMHLGTISNESVVLGQLHDGSSLLLDKLSHDPLLEQKVPCGRSTFPT